MSNLVVEKLRHCYVEQVCCLEKNNIGSGDIDSIIKTIDNEKLNYYLLLKDEELIGFFECLILPPEIELYDIVIDQKYQGFGYSKILMNYLLKLATQNNVETILLEVNSDNSRAINLYLKYGFKQYSVRKNYYGKSDAILMKLNMKNS